MPISVCDPASIASTQVAGLSTQPPPLRSPLVGANMPNALWQLAKEVNTEGWVACDTHVHTVTYSGHGDCTLQERLVTLAGEGIELPISTDHNTQIDYSETALALGLSKWFTSVVGNEVTTQKGHFNIFPTAAESARPNHLAANWKELFDSIFGNPQVKVAILNHARDLHSSFRPFSPAHHISLTGSNLDGFDRRFNAMELINSGAVQTDPMELFVIGAD